jgi:uncharacterized protein YprB with RNaseH-like and TPR domain
VLSICLFVSLNIFDILQVAISEVKEGTTYEPAIDLSTSAAEEQLQEIPERTLPPLTSTLETNNNTFLFFDLETTGLGKYFTFSI